MAKVAEPYRLQIVLEAASGVCLWSANPPAQDRFGYAVRPEDLGLSPEAAAAIAALIARYDAATDDAQFDPESITGPMLFGGEAAAAPFADEIEALRRRLQAELGPAFLIEHGFQPASEPVTFGWNHGWTLKAALGSLVMAGLSLWMAYAIGFEGFGDLRVSSRPILAAMFALFGLLFVATTVTYALAGRDGGAVVVIDDAGVLDRRLSSAPAPWSQIASVTPIQVGGQLMLALNLAHPQGLPLPPNPLWRVNRLCARLLGRPELAVKLTGLDGDLQQLLAAVTRARP